MGVNLPDNAVEMAPADFAVCILQDVYEEHAEEAQSLYGRLHRTGARWSGSDGTEPGQSAVPSTPPAEINRRSRPLPGRR